ncbi:hypothetical protein NF865_07640 [Thermococcus aggregans]|uniref:Uncharacterized protein n=1 Tax=Thermococcus aggregans TaxID=110163 RepID=A0A9E7MWK7_THEAG|nr:hypothetical protein [Thermococcus aggregans]USS40198.1 hypothetical protein NF865_07640 [Thermococcus aggregans]
MKKYLIIALLILLSGISVFLYVQNANVGDTTLCFSRISVNVSDVKPPIVVGPGFPPQAGFKGITLDEVVAGSPRHVLVGFFNFQPSNWTGERPRCYFKALEGYSENWMDLIMPGVSFSNVTLSGRVYLAVYVYPLEETAIIAKVNYGETPEGSEIAEAFRLKYSEPPGEIIDAYVSELKRSGYTTVRELSGNLFEGWVFRKGSDHLLVLKLRDEGNLYLLLARGEEADIKKLADAISSRG